MRDADKGSVKLGRRTPALVWRTPAEQAHADARVALYGEIVQRYGETGLLRYLKLSEAERVLWVRTSLPDKDHSQVFDVPAPDEHLPSLSMRMWEVVHCAARGLDGYQTAAELGISYRTVSFHLAHVYSRLGVNNIKQALAKLSPWIYNR